MRFHEHLGKYGRKYTQLLAAVLYNCHLTGFVTGRISKSVSKGICAPGLNCYSCPGAVLSCPLGSLQEALAMSAYRFPFYMLGTILLFGILLGRMICGFLCPFGLFQELLHAIPFPKVRKNRLTRALSYMKYVILALFVIAIPIIKAAPGFCKYFCPAGTIEAGIPLMILNEEIRDMAGFLFTWKVYLLVLCILLCTVCYRAFCRFFCPLGAIYSLFNPVAFFGLTVDKGKCTGCNACVEMCRMDVTCVGDRECIQCGACKKVCPKGAIRYRRFFDH
ncbi:MAG: 4Fe-4S binding protein [Lachnospiraceae bacterium]|nr:4Fe-4S binding protein [Lachnospiraceae bacterium]